MLRLLFLALECASLPITQVEHSGNGCQRNLGTSIYVTGSKEYAQFEKFHTTEGSKDCQMRIKLNLFGRCLDQVRVENSLEVALPKDQQGALTLKAFINNNEIVSINVPLVGQNAPYERQDSRVFSSPNQYCGETVNLRIDTGLQMNSAMEKLALLDQTIYVDSTLTGQKRHFNYAPNYAAVTHAGSGCPSTVDTTTNSDGWHIFLGYQLFGTNNWRNNVDCYVSIPLDLLGGCLHSVSETTSVVNTNQVRVSSNFMMDGRYINWYNTRSQGANNVQSYIYERPYQAICGNKITLTYYTKIDNRGNSSSNGAIASQTIDILSLSSEALTSDDQRTEPSVATIAVSMAIACCLLP
jgi:hypothetical protein